MSRAANQEARRRRLRVVPAIGSLLALSCFGIGSRAAEEAKPIDLSKLPPPARKKIDFARDVLPIFEHTCRRCHGPERPKSRFQLMSREAALKGGRHGIDIIPGHSAESPLIHYVARLVEDMEMPPEGKGQPLSSEQISLLRAWIDQGASWNAPAPQETIKLTAITEVGWIGVHGNKQQFRANEWQNSGFSGGLEDFYDRQQLDDKTSATAHGRVWLGNDQFDVHLTLDRRDFGFIRMGAERYRVWESDTGGYEPILPQPAFRLDRDLHLDESHAYFEAGLAMPDRPQITLGYEYFQRQGNRSTLHWGDVSGGAGLDKNIYPAAEHVNEQTHVVRLDAAYQAFQWDWEDNFRAEFYDDRQGRVDPLLVSTAGVPEKGSLILQRDNHFQAANNFHLERQWLDWLFLSGGYYYSQLNGEAAFDQSTFLTPGSPASLMADDNFWSAQGIVLEQSTHVFNANAQLGPWSGLTANAGVQSEWMRQSGLGDVRLDQGVGTPFYTAVPAHVASDYDRAQVEERAGFRYTTIPYTVVFGDGRLQQESIGEYNQEAGGPFDFQRNTEYSGRLGEVKSGLTVSPWPRVALTGQYAFRDHVTDYNHVVDEAFGQPNPGYPAFILRRDLQTQEGSVKLVDHWTRWFKTSASVRLVSTEYQTDTDPYVVPPLLLPGLPPLPAEVISPGGDHQAGRYEGRIFGADATLTPWPRLNFTEAFSYMENRTGTDHHSLPVVVDYAGGVYFTSSTVLFRLNPKTDLDASYSFTWADYAQDNYVAGLPLGISYTRQGLQAGLSRQLRKNITGRLQYAFFAYDEPTSGGANNYVAHGIFASLTVVMK